MSYLGQFYQYEPTPAGFMAGSPPRGMDRYAPKAEDEERPIDPRVKWAKKTRSTLVRQKLPVTEEIKRNEALYKGDTPWWKNRPRWKVGAKINYCVSGDTRIDTADGLIAARDLSPCDSPNGRIQKVWQTGVRETVVVETRRGFRIRCTPDHRLLTEDGWVEAKDVLGKRLKLQRPAFSAAPYCAGDVEITPDWGRFLGYYMGDGCCYPPKGTVSVACATTDPDVIADVSRLARDLLVPFAAGQGRVPSGEASIEKLTGGAVSVAVYRRSAVQFLQQLGVSSDLRRVVHVPECIWRSPRPVVREFLRGVFEADGSASARQRRIFLTAKDRDFLGDVALLLWGFGISGSFIRSARAWMLCIGASGVERFNAEIGFISERKRSLAERVRKNTRPPEPAADCESVISVLPAAPIPVYDLSVEGSHRFGGNGIVAHNCFWVPNQWASVLADNKPKVSFGAYRREDQWQADVLTAAWNDWYTMEGVQQVIRDAILLSRIQKKGVLRLVYDPSANKGRGDQVLTAISATQIYYDRNATSLKDAEVVLYEYRDSRGAILQRWPHLAGKLKSPGDKQDDSGDAQGEQALPPQSFSPLNSASLQPGGSGSTTGTSQNMAPYNAPSRDVEQQESPGEVVYEFWLRPKGPQSVTTVDRIRFTAGNEPACRKKYLDFEEGDETWREPLKTVVTEGGFIYELPLSQVDLLRWAEQFGGIRILEEYDSYEVVTDEVEVPLYPTGRRLVVVGDAVAEDGMNPFAHGKFPFIEIDAYKWPLSPFGMGDIDQFYDLQEFANRLFSLFLDAALLTANPIWRLPLSSELADEDITNAPGAIMREDPISLKLGRREKGPEMPAYLFQLLGFTIERIKEISGLQDVATGGKFKGQQAAETVSMYQEAAGVRFRDALHNVERAIVELGEQFISNVAQFYTTPKLVVLKNRLGSRVPFAYTGAMLDADLRVEAKSGSMLPTSPSARLNYLMSLLQSPKPIIDLPVIWKELAEFGVIDSESEIEQRIEKELASPATAWKVLGLQPQGGKNGKGSHKKPSRSPRSTRNKSPLS